MTLPTAKARIIGNGFDEATDPFPAWCDPAPGGLRPCEAPIRRDGILAVNFLKGMEADLGFGRPTAIIPGETR